MLHSHLELYIIAHLKKINCPVDVEIHLGQTKYTSQGFQMQGTQFWAQNFLKPLSFGPNTRIALHLLLKFTKFVFYFPRVVEIYFMQTLYQNPCFQT